MKRKITLKKFLRYINSHHRNIKFTCEEGKGNKISLLDISISRSNNALETSTFRKPTNFNSFLPTEYKRGLLRTFLCRIYNICSSYLQIHEEINHHKSVWQKNSFPLFFSLTIVFINFWISYSLNVYQILILLRRKK